MHIFDNSVQSDAVLAACEVPLKIRLSLTADLNQGNSALQMTNRRFVYIHATIICTSAGWRWVVFLEMWRDEKTVQSRFRQ